MKTCVHLSSLRSCALWCSFCKCAMPYNPDDAMYHCSVCKEWYHPRCLQLKKDIEADDAVPFVCPDCQRLTSMAAAAPLDSSPESKALDASTKSP
eukprot:SM000073S21420  [mRNA]  locus=s73:137164:137662:+ [translate_table: standard]